MPLLAFAILTFDTPSATACPCTSRSVCWLVRLQPGIPTQVCLHLCRIEAVDRLLCTSLTRLACPWLPIARSCTGVSLCPHVVCWLRSGWLLSRRLRWVLLIGRCCAGAVLWSARGGVGLSLAPCGLPCTEKELISSMLN